MKLFVRITYPYVIVWGLVMMATYADSKNLLSQPRHVKVRIGNTVMQDYWTLEAWSTRVQWETNVVPGTGLVLTGRVYFCRGW